MLIALEGDSDDVEAATAAAATATAAAEAAIAEGGASSSADNAAMAAMLAEEGPGGVLGLVQCVYEEGGEAMVQVGSCPVLCSVYVACMPCLLYCTCMHDSNKYTAPCKCCLSAI